MTEVRDHWNAQAALGVTSGTRDLIAVELERRAIAKHVKDGMRILDVGCGNGETALRLAREHKIEIVGIDYAPYMIAAARANLAREACFEGCVRFDCQDVLAFGGWSQPFDLIYTQRCLVNLGTWERQRFAIERIVSWLKPGGSYLAVECCQDGLDGINELRAMVNLPAITPPWHNRYLRLSEMADLAWDLDQRKLVHWVHTDNYSGGYYLLSRVVNAALAQQEGREPDYDSPINRLALELPAWITGRLGQGVMFVFKKEGESHYGYWGPSQMLQRFDGG